MTAAVATGQRPRFRTILCGVDGTAAGLEAVRQAALLAGREARLTLLAIRWDDGDDAVSVESPYREATASSSPRDHRVRAGALRRLGEPVIGRPGARGITDAGGVRSWDNRCMTDRTLREHVDEFGSRLLRIGAASTTLRDLAAGIQDGHAPGALLDLLDTVDRDLLLTAHDLDALREHARREARSLSGARD